MHGAMRLGFEIGIFLLASAGYVLVIYRARRVGMPFRGWWSNEGLPLSLAGIGLIGALVAALHFMVR